MGDPLRQSPATSVPTRWCVRGSRRALDLFLGPPATPGGPPRRITVGMPADLCLLAAPLGDALQTPSGDLVVGTIRAGFLTTPAVGGLGVSH